MNKIRTPLEVFDNCAEEYQEKFMNFDLYNDTFDLFCDKIVTRNASVLEIACGPGNVTRYLLTKRPDFKIFGIDISPNMIELAKANNPSAEFQLLDCRDIGVLRKTFDGIMCAFCLPYLSKPEALNFIQDAAKLVRAGGVLYISTMEDDNSKSGYKESSSGKDEVFINYHEADYLTRALARNNFEVFELQRKDFPAAGGTTKDLVIISIKI